MDFTERYNEIMIFNTIGGQLDKISIDSVTLQMDLIQEEYLELVEAFDNRDDIEYLDATCDLFVTVAGLMQKLEAAGFDVAGALAKVNANNLSKFPDYDVRGSHLLYQPNNTAINVNEQYSVVVYKDVETGKIKKPTNFVPVDLSGYKIDFLKGGV